MLGFTHAVQSNEAYQEVSLEQLSKIDPDILFISANEGKTIVDEWKTNPLWKNLKAVKNGQVYDADRDTWTRFRGIKSSETSAKDVLKKCIISRTNEKRGEILASSFLQPDAVRK